MRILEFTKESYISQSGHKGVFYQVNFGEFIDSQTIQGTNLGP